MEELAIEAVIEFAAKAGDVDIDDVIDGSGAGGFLPDVARQHFPGDDGSLIAEEVFEQIVFAGGEFDGAAIAGDGAAGGIEDEVGDIEFAGFVGGAAAQEGAAAGEEFGEGEGL